MPSLSLVSNFTMEALFFFWKRTDLSFLVPSPNKTIE